MKKTPSYLQIRTKTWIENSDSELLFGKGKTEILEIIVEVVSIAKAADKIVMSYKKAWTHIKILENNVKDELVISKKGGGGKGETTLTPKAKEFIENIVSYKKKSNNLLTNDLTSCFLHNLFLTLKKNYAHSYKPQKY